MRLGDIFQFEYFSQWNSECAFFYLLKQFLQRSSHEVIIVTSIGGEAHCRGNGTHRTEFVKGPFIPNHPSHADNTVRFRTLQRVQQSRGTDKFQNLVDAGGENLMHLIGDLSSVNKDLIHSVFAQ